jgi:mercuric reductase
MMDYDLVVIGSGAAGATAAITAVHLGASRVAIVERGPLWGTCVNTGCIPSKFLLSLADDYYYKNHGHTSLRVDSRFNLYVALSEKDAFIAQLKQKKTDRIITRFHIGIIEGSAEFLSPTTLQIGDRKVTADRIIIATGSSPVIPPIPGITAVPFMTNTEALNPERIPESLIIIGGRALGLEFAQLYTHLGTKVTLLQRSTRILPDEEPEIATLLAGYLREEGIDIRTGVKIQSVQKSPTGVAVTALNEGIEEVISAEQILLATGRSPNTKELRLDRVGVKTSQNGAILVDVTMRTSVPNIWAAGDVTGDPMLETAARYAGEIAAMNAFLELKRSFNHSFIPYGIYTMPQVAGVGLTEIQAQMAGLDPETRVFSMDSMARSFMLGDARGMVKIVVSKSDGCVLGVHVCSPLATEILQASVLAVSQHLPAQDLADMPHVFPTIGEAISICARAFRKNATGTCPESS